MLKKETVKTSITKIGPDQINIRGYEITDLIGQYTFGQVSWLLLTGNLPDPQQAKMFDAILVSSIDHGVDAPSTHVARTVASCGVPVQGAISAGINAIGEFHGGAGEACAHLLQDAITKCGHDSLDEIAGQIVEHYCINHARIPGFGHRMHNPDMRAVRLFELADELGLSGAHVSLAKAIQTSLREKSGKNLPINVDGAMAAILSDMGFDWRLGKTIFIIARTVGLAAHVDEQIRTGKPLKFAAPADVVYESNHPRHPLEPHAEGSQAQHDPVP